MVRLDFTPDRQNPIRSGEQFITLRPASARPVAQVGRPMALWVGKHSASAKLLMERRCVLRARLTLTPDGILRVRELTHAPEYEAHAQLVAGCERSDARAERMLPRLIAQEGFADYAAFYAAHKAVEDTHRRRTPKGRIERELVAWGGV